MAIGDLELDGYETTTPKYVIATYTSGGTKDVTSSATFTSSDKNVATIS